MAEKGDIVIPSSLDQIFERLPIGSVRKAMGNNLYGINFRQTGAFEPRNKDSQGFVFFTRPQLNLDLYNIINYRGFYNLLNDAPASYQRFTRLTLDPRLSFYGSGDNYSLGLQDALKDGGKTIQDTSLTSPFVNPKNIFIPTLTNHINTLSGWPDMTAPSFTSQAGAYGEEYSMIDGIMNNYESFDLDISFRNTKGNPLIYFFYVWVKYMTLVYEGVLDPYMDFIVENELDYCSRIYRVILDTQKKYVTQIACTGGSYPINVPTGSIFDFNNDQPLNVQNSEINIRFKSMGFLAFEDIIKFYFNSAVAIGNPEMAMLLRDDSNATGNSISRSDPFVVYRSNGMAKIPHAFALGMDNIDSPFFSLNYRAYPWINLNTSEMEWWVDESRLATSAASSILGSASSTTVPINRNSGVDEEEVPEGEEGN